MALPALVIADHAPAPAQAGHELVPQAQVAAQAVDQNQCCAGRFALQGAVQPDAVRDHRDSVAHDSWIRIGSREKPRKLGVVTRTAFCRSTSQAVLTATRALMSVLVISRARGAPTQK